VQCSHLLRHHHTEKSACVQAAQHVMSKFKNRKGKSKRWQYRAYAKAKRTFTSCVAKLKNLVTEHYDVILLPIFKTKDMVRRSSARTHGFNTSILSLNHFKFRQLLQAKCTVKGKSLVVCSEMYTSRTCGRCYRLHVRLGSSDVFTCPFCASRARRSQYLALWMRWIAASLRVRSAHLLPDSSGRLERGRQQCREQSLTDCSVSCCV